MQTRRLGALLLLAPAQSLAPAQGPSRLDVRVDPRIELLAIVNRLAGADEYRRAADSDYVRAVDARFAPFAAHDAVTAAREMRRKHGISYNAPPGLAVYLDSVESLKPIVPMRPLPPGLDARWADVDVDAFLAKLRDFARSTRFAEFFAEQRPFYDRVEAAYRAAASAEDFAGWFDGFFGERPRARFTVVPAPLHGPANYGCAATAADGSESLVQVLGVNAFDAAGAPAPGDGFVGLLVHEMAHAYCNPLVDARAVELDPAGERLFAASEAAMRGQAYANGRTVLCESFVRAVCVLHQLERHGEDAAVRELAQQEARGFLWTSDLVAVGRRFREKPPASRRFADCMPEVARAFEDAAKRDWKTADLPFRGPVNAAYTDRNWAKHPLVVAPPSPSPALEKYLAQMFDAFFKKKGCERVSAAELTGDAAKGRPLVLYGSPMNHTVLKRVCDAASWKIAADSITLGDRRFDGAGLVLIACWPSPLDSASSAVIYASHDDAALAGVNSLPHGLDDWLVARRGDDGKLVAVASGSFPKTLDGHWRPLGAK